MPLIIPKSVGGFDEVDINQPLVAPIEERASGLVVPASVGGEQPIQPEIEQPTPEIAKPLSKLIPQAIESVKEINAPSFGFMDMFTGSERKAATPELSELPEFGGTPESGAAWGILTTLNPKARVDMIKDVIPEAKFEQTEDGSTIIEVPGEDGNVRRSVLNRPGLSGQDFADIVAQVIQFFPAAKGAAFGKTLLQKVGIGALASGATEQALQEGGIEFLGRGQRDPLDTAVATVAGGVGEAIVPAVQAIRQGRQAAKVGAERAEIESVKKAIEPAQKAVSELEKATGKKVGLFPPQQTQIPSELMKQRILPQLDAGSKKAASALETQNKEAFEAVSELVNTIAGPEVVEAGGKRFRSAARTAIEAAKERRTAATSDIYKDAFKTGGDVNLQPTVDLIASNLKRSEFGGKLKTSMEKISGWIGRPTGGDIFTRLKTPSLEQLQNAKFNIDAMLEDVGSSALDTTTKRQVLNVQKQLVKSMEDSSSLYKNANEKFRSLSPAVNDLEESIIGAVSKIKEDNLHNVSRRIFSANSNPTVVRNAKSIIDKADPGAWDDMLRTELQRRVGGITELAEDIPGEIVGNMPGKLRRAVFGSNPEQRRTLLSAMNKDQRANFVWLDQVLMRASSGRAAGSPTASFGQTIERLRGVSGVLRDVILRPLDTLQKTGESTLFDRNVAALTDVLFDSNFKPQMSKLIKLNPNSPEAARALTQMLKPEEEK